MGTDDYSHRHPRNVGGSLTTVEWCSWRHCGVENGLPERQGFLPHLQTMMWICSPSRTGFVSLAALPALTHYIIDLTGQRLALLALAQGLRSLCILELAPRALPASAIRSLDLTLRSLSRNHTNAG